MKQKKEVVVEKKAEAKTAKYQVSLVFPDLVRSTSTDDLVTGFQELCALIKPNEVKGKCVIKAVSNGKSVERYLFNANFRRFMVNNNFKSLIAKNFNLILNG